MLLLGFYQVFEFCMVNISIEVIGKLKIKRVYFL